MKLRILDEATAELTDAIARYEAIEPGLGIRLKQETQAAVAWIAEHAELPRMRPTGYRRVNLKVFPYYAAYRVEADTIWILAIAHAARRPEYWIGRSPKPD